MSRIAIDARIIYTSTGRYVERLIDHLQKIDKQNEYVVLLNKKDFGLWEAKSPNFSKVMADYAPYTFAEQLQFGRLLYSLNADLVHFTAPHHPLIYLRPFVLTVHDLTLIDYVNRRQERLLKDIYRHRIKPETFKRALAWGVKWAKKVITPTDYVKMQAQERFGIDKSKLVRTYEAAETLSAKPKPAGPVGSKRFLLYVGNAYPYKNLERLIDAFAGLDDPGLYLVLAGQPDFFYDQLAKYVAHRNISNVVFLGFVNDGELAWLYRHAQLYVFPSLSEGFGLPGVEAMLYGLPVAAARASCLPEVYDDAAVYFDPTDTADIADVIKKTLGDSTLLAKLRKAGPARAAEFSWKRMAKQTLEVYSEALDSKRS